ncbi:MAG: single-stranded-DNA-specific exonuclease RecJ [Anaerolineales bacterium]|nr:single-stranded-DNA-specific exonuclease RecJ [Anaerolineales bacterium]
MIRKKWIFPNATPEEVVNSLRSFSRIEQQILFNRGHRTEASASAFLDPDVSIEADPYLIMEMKEAVRRINLALDESQEIVIYGDYDADGVTATALLAEALKAIGARVKVYFPDRFREGYGLNNQAVERIAASGASLLITVDCGVRAIDEVALATELGLDVIITDHHLQGAGLPGALAVLNPHRADTLYPYDGLAGVGVAYRFAQAIFREKGLPSSDEKAFLDFVAIGTIADMVPLAGENRALVKMGLELINSSPRIGLKALINVSGYREGGIDSAAVGFGLGPRLNAAGRVQSALPAYKLLVETKPQAAVKLAMELEQFNNKRKQLTLDVVERAVETFKGKDIEPLLMVTGADFHEGVVGLAASRICDEYYRPAIVGKVGESHTRASARSIPGFHITAALEKCSDLLDKFGGHEAAAGFSVPNENLQALQNRLVSIAEDEMGEEELIPSIAIDSQAEFIELGERTMQFIDQLQPCGQGNEWPVFCTEQVEVRDSRQVGSDQSHLKMTLRKSSISFDAIAFRRGEIIEQLPDFIDIAYRLERNTYLGYESLQLNIEDIQFPESDDRS